jgi:hypothetical protein
MNIIKLSPEDTLNKWPIISPILERARVTGQGESSLVDYMTKILNNYAQCWVFVEGDEIVGAGLTEILKYSQHSTLHIILLAGSNFEEMVKGLPAVEAFARASGCKSLEQWGKRGWNRVLPKHMTGFKEVYSVMRKDL